MRKGILGIKIKYKLSKGRPKYFDAVFYAGYSKGNEKGNEFISSKEIRKALEALIKTKKVVRRKDYLFELGSIGLMYDAKTKTAVFHSYFPLGENKKELGGKGIANYLELLTLKEMKKRIPAIKRVKHTIVTLTRINQLKKRKISHDVAKGRTSYSYREAIERLSEKLRRDIRKAKRKRIDWKTKRGLRKAGGIRGIRKLKRF
jgi:hypothetical protein